MELRCSFGLCRQLMGFLAKTCPLSCPLPGAAIHLTDSHICWAWVLSRKTVKYFLNGIEIGLRIRKVVLITQTLFHFTGKTLLVSNYWPIANIIFAKNTKLHVTKTVCLFPSPHYSHVSGPFSFYLSSCKRPKDRSSKQSPLLELCPISPSYKESHIVK